MGADMRVLHMWSLAGYVDPEAAKRVLRECFQGETRPDIIRVVSQCLAVDDLAVEVMLAEGPDGPLRAEWNGRVLREYEGRVDRVVDSLYSREVTLVRAGPLVGYVTGGLSRGEDPTSVFTLWDEMFFSDTVEYDANPYGRECYAAMGFVVLEEEGAWVEGCEWFNRPGQVVASVLVDAEPHGLSPEERIELTVERKREHAKAEAKRLLAARRA